MPVAPGSERKAERLLTAGRVTVVTADTDTLVADVEGDHATYRVTIGRHDDCPCPSWRRSCSHVRAVRRIAGDR